ncbi:hypothetical protein F5144DRAFT_389485 [Chaetomium tenue]|uniref:Uncharacterized protein n=1 Tax=Chaetomium tenue TaxID=1854479 RepID=A0ACB7NVQ8_9PEZI|nr:hypothetical protein F5144DRAFT_389485 [Chaetomium globosum]
MTLALLRCVKQTAARTLWLPYLSSPSHACMAITGALVRFQSPSQPDIRTRTSLRCGSRRHSNQPQRAYQHKGSQDSGVKSFREITLLDKLLAWWRRGVVLHMM